MWETDYGCEALPFPVHLEHMILPVAGNKELPKRTDCPKPVQSTQGSSIELIISGIFERDVLLAKDSLIMVSFPLRSSTPNSLSGLQRRTVT